VSRGIVPRAVPCRARLDQCPVAAFDGADRPMGRRFRSGNDVGTTKAAGTAVNGARNIGRASSATGRSTLGAHQLRGWARDPPETFRRTFQTRASRLDTPQRPTPWLGISDSACGDRRLSLNFWTARAQSEPLPLGQAACGLALVEASAPSSGLPVTR